MKTGISERKRENRTPENDTPERPPRTYCKHILHSVMESRFSLWFSGRMKRGKLTRKPDYADVSVTILFIYRISHNELGTHNLGKSAEITNFPATIPAGVHTLGPQKIPAT